MQQPFLAASFCRLQQCKHYIWRARRRHGIKFATKRLASRANCPLEQRNTCQLQVQTHSPIAPAAVKLIRRICVGKIKDLQKKPANSKPSRQQAGAVETLAYVLNSRCRLLQLDREYRLEATNYIEKKIDSRPNLLRGKCSAQASG